MVIFKKEKEVIELIVTHADTVESCLLTGINALEAYLKDDTRMAKVFGRQVDDMEGKADLIRHEIRDKLYSGAYMPLLREDIYKLVEGMDKVANAGEACCDFFLNQRPEIPDFLRTPFSLIAKESLGIAAPLREALLCFVKGECPVEVSRHHAKEVGEQETRVDRLEWDLTKSIFTSSMEFSRKLHLKLCLDAIAEVSDRAEDAADQLELVTFKSIF